VIHGDDDRILPIAASGRRTAQLIKGARQLVVKGPHCITWTHAGEVNAELLSFLSESAAKTHHGEA
jgi:pimeloyl-ACP methyl ester carboxylesterase